MSYSTKLAEMGITASRIEDLVDATNNLHRAISKLDNQQLKAYSSTFGLIGHLDLFAREEELRNVAVEMYNINLARAFKNIDFDEFPEFSDKLFYLAEEAGELNIPGAKQLCRSLIDMRKAFESKKRPFARFAAKMNHIGFLYPSTSHNLDVYIDGIYNSDNRHLNDEETVARARYLKTYTKEDDRGESGTDYMFIAVDYEAYDYNRETLLKAIRNTYRIDSCGHEYDCCRCRRQAVQHVKFLAEIQCAEIYCVKISWHLCV